MARGKRRQRRQAAEMQQDFATGEAYTNQREDIRPSEKSDFLIDTVDAYNKMVTPTAERMQDALVRLIGTKGMGANPYNPQQLASRFAGSEMALGILKDLPLYGAGMGLVGAGDIILGEENASNKAMDLLGMGVGAYGVNRGVNRMGGTTRAGQALAMAAGLGLGKMGSDATQGAIGGII